MFPSWGISYIECHGLSPILEPYLRDIEEAKVFPLCSVSYEEIYSRVNYTPTSETCYRAMLVLEETRQRMPLNAEVQDILDLRLLSTRASGQKS